MVVIKHIHVSSNTLHPMRMRNDVSVFKRKQTEDEIGHRVSTEKWDLDKKAMKLLTGE